MLKRGVERVAKIAEVIRTTSTLEVRPLRGEALGAEVIGFDFENAKTVEDVKELRKAFLQHQVEYNERDEEHATGNEWIDCCLCDDTWLCDEPMPLYLFFMYIDTCLSRDTRRFASNDGLL